MRQGHHLGQVGTCCPSPHPTNSSTPPFSRLTKLSSLIKVLNRINRAKAASANGFETLGLYAAAVVAANSAKIDLVKLNKLTIGYIISRAAYNFVYVQLQENRRLASVRSIAWGVGIYSIISLFLSAGSALNLRA